MNLNLFYKYPAFVFCFLSFILILDLGLWAYYCFHKKEKASLFIWRVLGSNFFLLYTGYKILLQIDFYFTYPKYTSFFFWTNWALVQLLFVFFAISYIIRKAPVSAANKIHEIILPLICALTPFGVYESTGWVQWTWVKNQPFLFEILKPFTVHNLGYWNGFSIVIILVGHIITLWGLFHLRSAFSIFTEARTHVQNGPYRFIRHPMYLGENLATIGFCIFNLSWFNIFLTLLYLILQHIRSGFEEHKLTLAFPGYQTYQNKTGRYFPKI